MIDANRHSTEALAFETLPATGKLDFKNMNPVRTFATLLLLAGIVLAASKPVDTVTRIQALSLSDLKQRLMDVDDELNRIASLSLLSGVGSVGYRSQAHTSPTDTEWVQIDLGNEVPVDEIVLVPTLWRDTKTGFRADGFPREFKIIAGTAGDPAGTVVASFGSSARLLPRIAPLAVSCPGTVASWIRVETVVMSPRAWDGKYIFQLAELLVFSGEDNIALHGPVKTSSPVEDGVPGWDTAYLVDGFVPYLMDAAEGAQSVAFVSKIGIGEQPVLSIDLGESLPLDRIHFHATDLSDTVPQAIPDDFGVPRRMVWEGANHPDFSDAVRLVEFHQDSVYNTGPIIMQRFPVTSCRYVRLTALEPFINTLGPITGSQFGAAEIQIFSGDRNVALGRPAQASFTVNSPVRSFAALTDGLNLYGKILPVRNWLNELALRHDLETERPVITAELDNRYMRQKANLNRLGWLAVLLAAGIVSTILIERIMRMRQIARIRERLAADLHDELGANLHTIGLLSDLASDARDSPEEMDTLYRRIRSETERSGIAVRHCSDMLAAKGLYTDLLADMQRASNRIMAKLEHEISIEGEPYLKALPPRTRADLFLFYKECLVNISRHSGATKYTTELKAGPERLHLKICDNGRGLEKSDDNGVPSSLKRRAKLLGAKVTVENPPAGGTRIELNLRTRKWGFLKYAKTR
jgi:signal transduction histidine kinase